MREELDCKELVIKFLAGEITESEIDVLKSCLDKNVENRCIFNQENELWQESGVKTKLEYFKTDEGWNNISSKLGFGENRYKSVLIINKYKFRMLLAAASVACLIAIGGLTLWLSERQSVKQTVVASTTVSTDEGEMAHIFLSDSTQVFMNSGSTLKYDVNYNINERKVNLSGEAFFNVRTNPEKPFVVQLDQMTVSATGTRFNVLSYGNENRIETTLEEGKIQVAIKGQETIEVKSGQQVVYFTKTNKAVVRDVSTETYTSWKENKLRFIDTPFEETLRKIGRKYNVTFQIQNRDLLDLKYTATFIDESIEEVMQMLKAVSPITYKIYYRTAINDKQYLKPKIVIGKRKAT
jgi:ferric-dicitrate binding protein FerR (iron transport regulator)